MAVLPDLGAWAREGQESSFHVTFSTRKCGIRERKEIRSATFARKLVEGSLLHGCKIDASAVGLYLRNKKKEKDAEVTAEAGKEKEKQGEENDKESGGKKTRQYFDFSRMFNFKVKAKESMTEARSRNKGQGASGAKDNFFNMTFDQRDDVVWISPVQTFVRLDTYNLKTNDAKEGE